MSGSERLKASSSAGKSSAMDEPALRNWARIPSRATMKRFFLDEEDDEEEDEERDDFKQRGSRDMTYHLHNVPA